MQTYSPFDRPITNLKPADLAILTNVREGWYVEYKSKLIDARALAKAVSAFANTYGGWLFLGVKEEGKSNPVAADFPGITDRDVDVALQRLRHSTAEHLKPTPYFETKILRGPCVEINLPEGVSVVAIEIPQSHTAPHIHGDGRIYRRVADGSEPKPETDRFVLDQLWRRAEPIRQMIHEWIERDPELSEAEEKNPYVRLLVCVDPWRQRDSRLDTSLQEIRSILTSHERDIPSIPFDMMHTTAEGFICRQTKDNYPHNYTLTWILRRDLSCDVILPLPFYTPNGPDNLVVDLDGYDHNDLFIDILKEQGHTRPRILDLNFMMNILTGVVYKYRRLLKLCGIEAGFYFKARVLNAWRILPFVDVEQILNEFRAHGIPMIMNNTVTFPTGKEPDSFSYIHEPKVKKEKIKEDRELEEKVVTTIQSIMVFKRIATAFGVPIHIEDEAASDELIVSYPDLQDAGVRAMIVQKNRNTRYSRI